MTANIRALCSRFQLRSSPSDSPVTVPPSPRWSEGRVHWLLILLLLLTFWLGARALNTQAIWYDEYWSLYDAGGAFNGPRSPVEVIDGLAERNPWQAPGFFLLLNRWGELTGWSILAARSLALLVGVLAVALAYRLGRDLFASPLVGLGSAVALATSAFFVAYLHELRGYTLLALFSLLSVWAYWRLVRAAKPSLARQALFVFAIAGLLYTHYFAAVTAAALALYHLLFVRKNRAWWRVVILMALAGILFLPWLRVMFNAISIAVSDESTSRQAASLGPLDAATQLLYLFSSGSVALLAVIGAFALRARGQAARLAWVWLIAGFALALLINARVPVLIHVRYLMMIVPALALLVGIGVERLARAGVSPTILLGIWIVAGVFNGVNLNFMPLTLDGQGTRVSQAGMSAIVETLRAHENRHAVAVFHFVEPGNEWWSTPMLDYYMNGLRIHYRQYEDIPGLQADDDYLKQAQKFIDDAPFVWTAIMPAVPSPYQLAEFARALQPGYADCGIAASAPDIVLHRYARTIPLADADLRFGGGSIGLDILEAPRAPVNDALSVLIGVALSSAVPPNTYSFALHLDDASGSLVAQQDQGLPDAPFSCVNFKLDVSTLAPGDYTLKALVYNWQTSVRLTGTVADGGAASDRLTLRTVHIG